MQAKKHTAERAKRQPRNPRRELTIVSAALLIVYVGSYLALSRSGYARAERLEIDGFYYLMPEDHPDYFAHHQSATWFFTPLNAIDRWLGTGRVPAEKPLWKLGD